ncbi:hypothetical protein J3459_011397 [Metarhizium acridum]|uniref:uncharacterized protein n=1 Tax=Metarhizium acridum TaxID=92637 RepID=UPI001C6C296D|nr:hypothetical protein J3458_021789 [Metarhizium acridum]KAG8405625.1 hypothetical protein J3459_021622 [Metarhizium acridum]KAG8405847.1 hypothetical protein J3458_021778 [Metarhizium acridum]KAG8420085.1 hypothetical protein J3459_011397 [Metarhizium acridum]
MGRPEQAQFAALIANYTAQAGIKKPVYMFRERDVWTQDYFEPRYASMPGPEGPVYLRVNIRSSQSWRGAGRRVFSELRSDSVGALQYFPSGNP